MDNNSSNSSSNNNSSNNSNAVMKDKNEETRRKPYAVRLPGTGGEKPPRAVVLVFGWAFSRMKHVRKYSELYEDRGCATITGILDPRSVAIKNDAAIGRFVDGAMEEAAVLIRSHERENRIPVLVHGFCNGGGFCRLGLHEALATSEEEQEQDHDDESTATATATATARKIIRDRLSTEVLDSAPIYISTRSSLAALRGVVKNPLVFWVLAIGGTVANYAKWLWSLLTTGEAFYETYWKKTKDTDGFCRHQFFVYSEADPVCDHERVDEFVEHRRARAKETNGTVAVVKFADTGHCRHLQAHREQYCAVVDAAIERATTEPESDRRRSKL